MRTCSNTGKITQYINLLLGLNMIPRSQACDIVCLKIIILFPVRLIYGGEPFKPEVPQNSILHSRKLT